MIPENIQKNIFGKDYNALYSQNKISDYIKILQSHLLHSNEKNVSSQFDITLPKLSGNVVEHFYNIANSQNKPYKDLCLDFLQKPFPSLPHKWNLKSGWTKYSGNDFTYVPFPEEDIFVFDVEVSILDPGNKPTLAIMLSNNHWYSWTSPMLENSFKVSMELTIDDMIPLGDRIYPTLVIGHNVAYDRTWIKEQYQLKRSKMRFLDTMSLHLACSGLTHLQRVSKIASKREEEQALNEGEKVETSLSPFAMIEGDWKSVGALNNLADIHELYCDTNKDNHRYKFSVTSADLKTTKKKSAAIPNNGKDKSNGGKDVKQQRKNILRVNGNETLIGDFASPLDVFLRGKLEDVVANFQICASYCARDCLATVDVLRVLYPMFCERFPHPITFAGMLELGTTYLPTQQNTWETYIDKCETLYKDIDYENRLTLAHLANDACTLLHSKAYEKDPWLWDLDWSVQKLALNKSKTKQKLNQIANAATNTQLASTLNYQPPIDSRQNFFKRPDATGNETMKQLDDDGDNSTIFNSSILHKVLETADYLPKVPPHLPGYPTWYRELCEKPPPPPLLPTSIPSSVTGEDSNLNRPIDINQLKMASQIRAAWKPGPFLLTSLARVAPKLLRLTWNGYPLYFHPKYKWGYLVPGNLANLSSSDNNNNNLPNLNSNDGPKSLDEDDTLSTAASIQNKSFILQNLPKYLLDQNLSLGANQTPSAPDSSSLPRKFGKMEATDTLIDNILWKDVMNATYEGNLDDLNQNFSKFLEHARKMEKLYKLNHNNPTKSTIKKSESSGPSSVSDNGAGCQDVPGCWFFPLPHKNGPSYRVGNPLSKDFIERLEDGTLKACSGTRADKVLINSKVISYWKNSRLRILSQLLVYDNNHQDSWGMSELKSFENNANKYGAILPRLIVCGTVSRRAVETTWLTASNSMTDRLGSELKAMIQAPPGYCFVGADVDSQELWIASILGDANTPLKIHGCTPFGWMTIQGNKQDKTDMHSKTASLLKISRDQAKVLNYARIYGAGQIFASRLLKQFVPEMSKADASKKARDIFRATKGRKSESMDGRGTKIWVNGTESHMFNKLEEIATSPKPATPFLGSRICRTLEPENVNNNFMTSRTNWVVQSSAVDFLHLMLVCMNWLFEEFQIDGRFCISIHDEVRYIVAERDKYRAALALQITNLLTRSFFSYRLGMFDLPMSVAFFSAVDIDKCLRKEVNTDCVTPSNAEGLQTNYAIPFGEALNIYQIIEKTGGKLDSL